jgi:hypothetical protein
MGKPIEYYRNKRPGQMKEDWDYLLSEPVKSIMRSQWKEGISTHYKTLSLWTPFAEAVLNK